MDQKNIRNFAIIAHIDHGKSTLADRFLEITKTISKDKIKEQFLDQNPISRERGITIKLAPIRMLWHPQIRNPKSEILNKSEIKNSKIQNDLEFRNSNFEFADSEYILNLIDTPGHIDFSYEVSRTLAACEGAILLVDATQGIQAQTVAHFNDAKKENLTIIPVINKIDLSTAKPSEVAKELVERFGFPPEEIYYISAKSGLNIESLLAAIVKKIPPPKGLIDSPSRSLIFDAAYDEHRGVIAFIRVVDGKFKKDDKIRFFQSDIKVDVGEVGVFSPFLSPKDELSVGEIGYLVTGIKDIRLCRVGDTITIANLKSQISNLNVKSLPGYEAPKPMVFFGVYPKKQEEYIRLREAIDRLSLNDASLKVAAEYSAFLGSGFRIGFLGLLHAEIFKERLKQEENADPLLTMPRVLYKTESGEVKEPYMNLIIYAPSLYVGAIMTVCQKKKGKLLNLTYHKDNAILKYEMPYSMFIRGLSAELKAISQGFASIDYELTGYKKADLVNLEILINSNPVDVLSELVYKDEVNFFARQKVEKLRELLPRQQVRQIIQAVVGGKILAKEEIPPFRKDVIAKLYGGDRTRKDKLLKKQKKGKSKLLLTAKINIPQKALLSMLGDSS